MAAGELPIRWRDLDPYGHVNHAVYFAVTRLGRTSATTRERLLTAAGEEAAPAETVLVAVERSSGTPRALTDAERARLS